MAEEGEGIKKKVSEGALDVFNRLDNWIKFGVRKATFDYIRFKSVKTRVAVPIEKVLKWEIGKHITNIFGSHISKLRTIESNWAKLRKHWVQLMNYYAGMGLKRSEELTGPEIAMCKFGTRLTEREIRVAMADAKKDEKLKKEGKEPEKREPTVDSDKIMTLFKDIEEEGLTKEGIERKRKKLRKALCPLNNPDNVEWPKIKIKIGKDKDGKDIYVEEEYPLPKEIKLKTWSSLIDDVNFALDRYPARFFGFEKYEDWTKAFEIVTERICNKVMKKLQKSDEFKKLLEEKGRSPKYVEELIGIGGQSLEAFTTVLKDKIMPEVVLFDSKLYPYLRTRTQQWGGRISALSSEIDDLRPSIPVNVYFERTYKIIDPKRLIRARVYNNAYLLYKELVRLNNLLFPKDRFKDLGVTRKEIKMFEGFEEQVEIPEISEEAVAEMSDVDLDKATTTQGAFFYYLEYKYANETNYNYCLNLEKKLQRKFEEVNDRLKDKKIKGYYLTWGMIEGASFENRRGHPDERAPGLDENGWPFEVEKDGTILLDRWEHRAERGKERKVPRDFVVDMDLLLKTNLMNNEYDAIRDDIRDGRYHINSLTIYECILAEMAKWGPESSKLIKKEFKTRLRYTWNLSDKSAEYTMNRYGGEPPIRGKRIPNDLNPAFDLRAFKEKTVMDNWIHLGRKRYYDTAKGIWDQLTDKDLRDPKILKAIGPNMTTRGLSMYIIEKVMANVRDFEDAGKILERIASEGGPDVWYDYGPRGFNKPGPKNPLNLNIQELTASLDEGEILKLFGGVTSIEDNIEGEVSVEE